MKKLLGLVVLLAVLVGAWWFASPWWTLKEMRDAGKAGDAAAISAYIDYPALRDDMKAEMRGAMEAEAARRGMPGLGDAGAQFLSQMIEPAIDAMITPEAMEDVFSSAETAQGMPLPAFGGEEMPDIERKSLNRFVARPQPQPGQDGPMGGIEFARDGLGWKMVGIDLPEDAAPAE